MELSNQKAIVSLLRRTKELGKTIWLYSGYTLEELMDKSNKRCHGPYTDEILYLIDVLVDGEFVLEKKNISLAFKGSENQRIIHLPIQWYKNNSPDTMIR